MLMNTNANGPGPVRCNIAAIAFKAAIKKSKKKHFKRD